MVNRSHVHFVHKRVTIFRKLHKIQITNTGGSKGGLVGAIPRIDWSDKVDFFSHQFSANISLTRLFPAFKPVLPFQYINCNALSSPVMKCMKKVLLVSAIAIKHGSCL